MTQHSGEQGENILEIDLKQLAWDVLRALKRLWFVLLALVILCAYLVEVVQKSTYTPVYRAYCSFSVRVINKSTSGETNSLYAVYYDKDLAEQMDKTFSYLLTSDLITDDIKTYLGEDSVDGTIKANCIKGSNIFVLSTYSKTPENAEKLLNAVIEVYGKAARLVIGDMTMKMIEPPTASRTPYNAHSRIKSYAIGAMLGIALDAMLIFAYIILKRTVLMPQDLEKHVNMPCLGVVPFVQTKRQTKSKYLMLGNMQEQGPFRESVRGIARKLEQAMEKENAKVLLITSTEIGEGKSTMSCFLAEVLAHWGRKVILFDGDLRKPSLLRRYGINRTDTPLEDVLSGDAGDEQILFPQAEQGLTVAGSTVVEQDPTTLIDSKAMGQLIDRLAAQADILIIDSPPCGRISDASIYQQYADSVLYVVQQDRVPRSEIAEAVEGLCNTGNKLLGYVLNGVQRQSQGYGKYGYGKYSYGKYGSYYGKYGYGRYSSYGERDGHSRNSER